MFKIITVIMAFGIMGYGEIAAQSKGFNDTVILKNGNVLTGVKATVTRDSVVVTTSEGETSVYNKKEVSEMKKGGSNKTADRAKSTLSSGSWSEYQGAMGWTDADEKCETNGMRLPTEEELVTAQKAGLWKNWQKDETNGHSVYWCSDDNSALLANGVNMEDGDVHRSFKAFASYYVRCIGKKDVLEAKKVGSNKTTDKVKSPSKSSSGSWSEYQGAMGWTDANDKCKSIGMRLPTEEELVTAQKAGLWEKWQKERTNSHSVYWTSKEHSVLIAYGFSMEDGDLLSLFYFNGINVRCVR